MLHGWFFQLASFLIKISPAAVYNRSCSKVLSSDCQTRSVKVQQKVDSFKDQTTRTAARWTTEKQIQRLSMFVGGTTLVVWVARMAVSIYTVYIYIHTYYIYWWYCLYFHNYAHLCIYALFHEPIRSIRPEPTRISYIDITCGLYFPMLWQSFSLSQLLTCDCDTQIYVCFETCVLGSKLPWVFL